MKVCSIFLTVPKLKRYVCSLRVEKNKCPSCNLFGKCLLLLLLLPLILLLLPDKPKADIECRRIKEFNWRTVLFVPTSGEWLMKVTARDNCVTHRYLCFDLNFHMNCCTQVKLLYTSQIVVHKSNSIQSIYCKTKKTTLKLKKYNYCYKETHNKLFWVISNKIILVGNQVSDQLQ